MRIPKPTGKLQRPSDQRHALALIEGENVWITSRNRELAELLGTLISDGQPLTVEKPKGVIVWGSYGGQLRKDGSVVLDRKPDGRFKLVALDLTPDSLLQELSARVGRAGSLSSEEGRHGLVYRGVMRTPDERYQDKPSVPFEDTPDDMPPAEQGAGETYERVTGEAAQEAIGQKVALEFLELGVKVRIRGKRAECEAVAERILKGRPTCASQQGAKYMIEGNIAKPFLRKGANQQGPNASGVWTREDSSERTFTAFGENLPAVQAACENGCKDNSMFTIVVNDRSKGYFVIAAGKRKAT